jgi:orotidine-5'-phosphate decarboxylase
MAALPHFADRLLDACASKGAPICVGIDPILELMPPAVSARTADANDPRLQVDAIFDFTLRVLNVVAPLVPVVKFQSAFFEKYYAEGIEAYYSLIGEARELGLLVIGDVKRGDIGSTSAAYAEAHLADPPAARDEDETLAAPDAITISPICGLDSLEPFIASVRQSGKGLFVLVRTSNPGSTALQDLPLVDGRTWSQALADQLAPLAADPTLLGTSGFSNLGAVVGATQATTMAGLRQRLPQSIFLLPGYGTQGASAEMTQAAFVDGRGAIVSASRSILYAHRDPRYAELAAKSWESAVERATQDMRDALRHALGS